MEDYKKYQIPAFGYWDFNDDLPITQYFESARHAGLLRYGAGAHVDADLYANDLKMATANVMIPPTSTYSRPKHQRTKASSKAYHEEAVEEQKKIGRVGDVTDPPRQTRAPKAVDEDLYKIPPELLHQKPKKNKMLGFLGGCFVLKCVV